MLFQWPLDQSSTGSPLCNAFTAGLQECAHGLVGYCSFPFSFSPAFFFLCINTTILLYPRAPERSVHSTDRNQADIQTSCTFRKIVLSFACIDVVHSYSTSSCTATSRTSSQLLAVAFTSTRTASSSWVKPALAPHQPQILDTTSLQAPVIAAIIGPSSVCQGIRPITLKVWRKRTITRRRLKGLADRTRIGATRGTDRWPLVLH